METSFSSSKSKKICAGGISKQQTLKVTGTQNFWKSVIFYVIIVFLLFSSKTVKVSALYTELYVHSSSLALY